MRKQKPTTRRHAAAVTAFTLLTFALGAMLAVFVAGSASAAGSKSTTKKTTTSKTTTTKTTTSKSKPKSPTSTLITTGPDTPASHFFVINGTVNAASDHEIVGSSAFPNFTTGAVDNYYSKAHSHVDNSPFAEGTASPADTGPIGQTAAAGNFQQPQYADARWPGDAASGKASYGNQGGPYATAAADEYLATADAEEARHGLSAPGPTGAMTLAVPKGFDLRLSHALAGWKAKYHSVAPKKPPAVTTPVATVPVPKVPLPKVAKPATPKVPVATPAPKVTTPVATVSTPLPDSSGGSSTPQATVPTPTLPIVGAAGAPRKLASASSSTPSDGATSLTSSTLATLDSKTETLITSGESSLKRVSIGGGQIVIEGIHVTASITNDGNPSYKAAVSVASATIGGIPVTIDQDGVHVAGQGGALPYQQASDALNTALKQAGIQLFLVGPEVTTPCGQSSTGTGGSSGSSSTTTSSTTTTTSSTSTNSSGDQSSTPGSCDQTGGTAGCDSSGGSGGTGPSLPSIGSSPTTTSSSDQTDTTSCDQTDTTSCDQNGTTTNGTTTTSPVTGIGPGTTTTKTSSTKTSTDQTDTSTTSGGCGESGTVPSTSSCGKAGTSTGTTSTSTSTDQTDTNSALNPLDPMGLGSGSNSEETVTATGVHLVFTQPVNASGVPAQYVEHILGEVFVDSLAVPAGNPPDLGLSGSSSSSSSAGALSAFSASSCGGKSSKTTAGGASTAGGSGSSTGGGTSATGGSTSGSGALSGSASGSSGYGSGSQPGSGSGVSSLPAAFAAALRKPLWLLLAYLVWQALVVATGASLWQWRKGEVT